MSNFGPDARRIAARGREARQQAVYAVEAAEVGEEGAALRHAARAEHREGEARTIVSLVERRRR